jgi:hypothetical protein
LLAASELRAQDRFWNPATTSANWNTTAPIWGANGGGPFTSTWVNGANPNLNAAPGGSTATLTTAVTTADLFFYSGNFTVAAASGGSLTLAEGVIVANTGTGSTNHLLVNTAILGATFVQFSNTGGASSGKAGIYLNADNTFSFGISIASETRVGIGTADPAVGPVRAGTLQGDVEFTFGSVLSFQSTQTYSGVVTGFGDLEVVSPPAGSTTLNLTRPQAFTGAVRLLDNSTLALLNNGTTTSATLEFNSRISLSRSATLDLTGHTNGTWTLTSGKTLQTGGTTTANGGRILGPARIEGTLDLTGEAATGSGTLRQEGGNLTIAGGATWRTSIANWTGITPGTSFSQVSGVGGAKLDLSGASPANRIVLDVRGQSLTGFDPLVPSSWVIADFSAGNVSGGIVSFSSDKFQIDTSSFGPNLDGGSFALLTDAASNRLTLSFTPVPEPAKGLGLAAAGLCAVGLLSRRSRRTRAVSWLLGGTFAPSLRMEFVEGPLASSLPGRGSP